MEPENNKWDITFSSSKNSLQTLNWPCPKILFLGIKLTISFSINIKTKVSILAAYKSWLQICDAT